MMENTDYRLDYLPLELMYAVNEALPARDRNNVYLTNRRMSGVRSLMKTSSAEQVIDNHLVYYNKLLEKMKIDHSGPSIVGVYKVSAWNSNMKMIAKNSQDTIKIVVTLHSTTQKRKGNPHFTLMESDLYTFVSILDAFVYYLTKMYALQSALFLELETSSYDNTVIYPYKFKIKMNSILQYIQNGGKEFIEKQLENILLVQNRVEQYNYTSFLEDCSNGLEVTNTLQDVNCRDEDYSAVTSLKDYCNGIGYSLDVDYSNENAKTLHIRFLNLDGWRLFNNDIFLPDAIGYCTYSIVENIYSKCLVSLKNTFTIVIYLKTSGYSSLSIFPLRGKVGNISLESGGIDEFLQPWTVECIGSAVRSLMELHKSIKQYDYVLSM